MNQLELIFRQQQDGYSIEGLGTGCVAVPADNIKLFLDKSIDGHFWPFECHLMRGRTGKPKYDKANNIYLEFTRLPNNRFPSD